MEMSSERLFKNAFIPRSVLLWLLTANIASFALFRILAFAHICGICPVPVDAILNSVSLSPHLSGFIRAPWTLLTYPFSQYDPAHLIFNLLWIAWFGRILQLLRGNNGLLVEYLLGALGGAVFYWVSVSVGCANHASPLMGASASAISLAVAAAIIAPEKKIPLFWGYHLELRWVTVLAILIVIFLDSGYNASSDFAHLGGASAGSLYGLYTKLRHRKRSSIIPSSAPTPICPRPDKDILDSLLDKIRLSGYSSLSEQEKKTLFEISKRLKE